MTIRGCLGVKEYGVATAEENRLCFLLQIDLEEHWTVRQAERPWSGRGSEVTARFDAMVLTMALVEISELRNIARPICSNENRAQRSQSIQSRLRLALQSKSASNDVETAESYPNYGGL